MNGSLDNNKKFRVLEMYTKLLKGQDISKAEEARSYGMNERSIQRDIESIRHYLESDVSSSSYGVALFIIV